MEVNTSVDRLATDWLGITLISLGASVPSQPRRRDIGIYLIRRKNLHPSEGFQYLLGNFHDAYSRHL